MTLRKTKITEMNRLDKASFDASDKIPLTIVLDNVRSMNNVGSVFRTADVSVLSVLSSVVLQLGHHTPIYTRPHLGLRIAFFGNITQRHSTQSKGLLTKAISSMLLSKPKAVPLYLISHPKKVALMHLCLATRYTAYSKKLSTSLHTA